MNGSRTTPPPHQSAATRIRFDLATSRSGGRGEVRHSATPPIENSPAGKRTL